MSDNEIPRSILIIILTVLISSIIFVFFITGILLLKTL
jgi:hypothetical protein